MKIKKENKIEEKYICPHRAAKKLKLAQGMRQAVYLYGMTGSGKTALVKNVLSRKQYHYYSAKGTSAAQIRVSEEEKDPVVVVDDLQEMQDERQREEYAARFGELLSERRVWLLLLSRCGIPQWLMPLYVEHTFLVIEEEDLQLDRWEQDAYFEKWNLTLLPERAEQIWKTVCGSPFVLRFLAMAGGDEEQALCDLWKYLFYIYDQWDAPIQEFIAETAVLGRFDVRMAQMVTGKRNVRQLIRQVQETGNFLKEKDGTYEYRFMMWESIRVHLEQKFSTERLARIYYNAGHMYEMYGDIPRALQMHEAGGDQESILRLLVANARENPASGHYFELRRYYFLLPEEAVCTSPVLMAGMSMLHSMLMNKEESERWYRLLEKFAAENEGSGRREAKNRLLYLDIALPHRGTVQLVNLLKHAGTLLKAGKAALPEFSVTSNLPSLMNGGKDFCEWSKRDQELAASIGKIVEFVLGKYGRGLVSIALAESYFEKGMDGYTVVSLAEKGRMQAEAGGKTEQVFAAVGILVWLSVLNGHAEDAEEILESFRQKAEIEAPQLLANLAAFRCRISLYKGKTQQVQRWMEEAPDENKDFCSLERLRYLTKVRGYIQFGKYEKAYRLLQKMMYYVEEQKRIYVAMESKLLLALVKYRMGEEGWKTCLQECITQAEGYHFVRIFSREGGAVWKLLKEGNFTWEKEEYRKQVFQECEQMERYFPSYLKEKAEGGIVLSPNALSILRLQAEGYRVEQIADLLGITANTVKYHSKETYRKLGVSGKAAAVSEAKNRGLI